MIGPADVTRLADAVRNLSRSVDKNTEAIRHNNQLIIELGKIIQNINKE